MALKNLFGDISLEGTQQTLQYYLSLLTNKLNFLSYTTDGRLRVSVSNEGGLINTVGTVSNQTGAGGYNMSYDQYGQMQGPVDSIRSKITVS